MDFERSDVHMCGERRPEHVDTPEPCHVAEVQPPRQPSRTSNLCSGVPRRLRQELAPPFGWPENIWFSRDDLDKPFVCWSDS